MRNRVTATAVGVCCYEPDSVGSGIGVGIIRIVVSGGMAVAKIPLVLCIITVIVVGVIIKLDGNVHVKSAAISGKAAFGPFTFTICATLKW